MNEEDQVPEQEELDINEPEVDSQEEEVQQEEVKTKAKSTGHLTKEEFVARGGKSENYKTEKEFVLTGELIELKKAVQKRDKDIEEIVKFHQNTIEAQKINFRQQLDQQLLEARQTGDVDKVESLTRDKINTEQKDIADRQQTVNQQIKTEIDSFVARNSHWYNPQHQELVNKAHELETKILNGEYQRETGIPKPVDYEGVLKQVELAMKYEEPDIVPTQGQRRPVISNTASKINQGSDIKESDNALYAKLGSQEQAMYNVTRRMLKKQGIEYSVKEFVVKSRRDEEI